MSEKQIKGDLKMYLLAVTRITVTAELTGKLDDFDVKARMIDMFEDELAALKGKWATDADIAGEA